MVTTGVSFLSALCVVACVTVSNVQVAVALEAEPFELSRVRLLAGPFKDAQERDRTAAHVSSQCGPAQRGRASRRVGAAGL